MDIMEQNVKKLSELWEKYHETTDAFNNLTIDGNYLIYNGNKVDISKFPLEYLFIYGVLNETNIINLNSEDIFRLVRLYALSNQPLNLESTTSNNNKDEEKNNQEKLEELKEKSPLLKRINIAYRYEENIPVEYINIVGDNGFDYLFINDRHFKINDLFQVIESNQDLTANDIISLMNQKLPSVPLKIAGRILDDEKTSEAYKEKIQPIDEKYKDDKTNFVLGNEEHDIVIISDKTNPENHKVVTFAVNELGQIETQDYQNVEKIKPEITHQEELYLIPIDEFYNLLNSNIEYNEEQRISVNNYYEYFADLLMYQEYLTDDLNQILTNHKIYISNLITYQENGHELTNNQLEAIQAFNEAQNRSNTNNLSSSIKKANVKTLSLKYNNISAGTLDDSDMEEAGFASTVQVIIFVLAFATILTALTLYILE